MEPVLSWFILVDTAYDPWRGETEMLDCGMSLNTQGTLQEGFVTEFIILKVCHKKGNLKANIAKY